jgi:hypothetical protein
MKVGPAIYFYGLKDPGTDKKLAYLARTNSVGGITNPAKWEYWNATQNEWLAGQSNATPLSGVAAIPPEYSVDPIATGKARFYLMTGMNPLTPPYPLWDAVTTWHSCSPEGPWKTQDNRLHHSRSRGQRLQSRRLTCLSSGGASRVHRF